MKPGQGTLVGSAFLRVLKRIPYYATHPIYTIERLIERVSEPLDSRHARNWGERLVIRGEVPSVSMGRSDQCTLTHIQRYLWAGNYVSGLDCLDDGCGSGYGSYYLAKYAKAKRVVGIDLSKDAIDYARGHFQHPGLQFFQMSCLELKFPREAFDVVVSFEVLENISEQDQDAFVKETRRVLKRGGVLLLSTPNKAVSVKGNPFHLRELLPSELLELLRRHYENVELFGQDVVIGGKRSLAEWHRHAYRKLYLNDVIITNDRVEQCFSLLAVCR